MAPVEPSRPRILINILGSIVGGLLLGAAIAVGLEFRDRRVRNAADIAVLDGIPLLGVLSPRPVGRRAVALRTLFLPS